MYRSDLIVIGSSPVALAYAIKNAKTGVKTTVVECDPHLGGAWQVFELECGARVEIACHLFEYYRGGYELLADYSTVPFDVLEAQPFKLLPNGSETPYSTRGSILSTLLYYVLGYLAVSAIDRINSVLPHRAKLMKHRSLDSAAWRNQLLFQYKQRASRLHQFDGIRFPRGGVDAFIDGLVTRLESLGGRIVVNECGLRLIRGESSWRLLGRNGSSFESTRVAITESAHLESVTVSGIPRCLAPKYTTYWHLLVSLPRSAVRRAISYVHLPENPYFHRVTIIDVPKLERDKAYFLIQSRIDLERYADILAASSVLLQRIGITEHMTELTIEARFVRRFVQSGKDIQLPEALTSAGVEVIHSIGDVARNFCANFGDEVRK